MILFGKIDSIRLTFQITLRMGNKISRDLQHNGDGSVSSTALETLPQLTHRLNHPVRPLSVARRIKSRAISRSLFASPLVTLRKSPLFSSTDDHPNTSFDGPCFLPLWDQISHGTGRRSSLLIRFDELVPSIAIV